MIPSFLSKTFGQKAKYPVNIILNNMKLCWIEQAQVKTVVVSVVVPCTLKVGSLIIAVMR